MKNTPHPQPFSTGGEGSNPNSSPRVEKGVDEKAIIKWKQGRVCDLLQWQPGKLAMFIYERGHDFLSALFGDDHEAIHKLSSRLEFWNWWKMQWNVRDEVYLDQVDGRQDELAINTRGKLYSSLHSAEILAAELTIPRIVYPADFTIVKIEMA
jgi:hypothetical protein